MKRVTICGRTFDNIYQNLPQQVVRYILEFHKLDITVIEDLKRKIFVGSSDEETSSEEGNTNAETSEERSAQVHDEEEESEENDTKSQNDKVEENIEDNIVNELEEKVMEKMEKVEEKTENATKEEKGKEERECEGEYESDIFKDETYREKIDSEYLNIHEFTRILFGYFKHDRFRHAFLVFPNLICQPIDNAFPLMPCSFRYLDIVDHHLDCRTNFHNFFRLESLYIFMVKFCNFETKFPKSLKRIGYGLSKENTYDERIFGTFPTGLKELGVTVKAETFEFNNLNILFPNLKKLRIRSFKRIGIRSDNYPLNLKILRLVGRFSFPMSPSMIVDIDVSLLKFLERIELRYCYVKRCFMRSIRKDLVSLSIENSHVEGKCLSLFPENLKKLVLCDLEFSDGEEIVVELPRSIETIYFVFFDEDNILRSYDAFLTPNCSFPPNVKELSIKEGEWDEEEDDEKVQNFGTKLFEKFPNKENIEILYCEFVKYPLRMIARECIGLKELHLGSNSFFESDIPQVCDMEMIRGMDKIRYMKIRNYDAKYVPRFLVDLEIKYGDIFDETIEQLPPTLRKVCFFLTKFYLKKSVVELISHLKVLSILHLDYIDVVYRKIFNEKKINESRPDLYVQISNF